MSECAWEKRKTHREEAEVAFFPVLDEKRLKWDFFFPHLGLIIISPFGGEGTVCVLTYSSF